ncbi:PD-(D/E)XK nuclease family protein [Nanchangia anserum]|uniref:PD-(D/E)XK nuclease family protein n=1 Tax=Nanchangia anserum TaxID=2692125 RepID=A0A8I0G6H5_9ACTO|nr:PD-(D/E)XK nuclease family protein [Nanchangia anserum]MBD3688682.1 PD-(D/E)XK nuclease family protein [Nanchangia anserum]QOX82433.1 PD-(D/E)XK nuclease family protein [Nanchangia anserum]
MSLPALSPSRANDFRKCPLQFRLTVVDRIPSPPAPARERGTLVHQVLEDLFDLPENERTSEHARDMLAPAWAAMVEKNPDLEDVLFTDGLTREAFLAEAAGLVDNYFSLENPSRLAPTYREHYVRATVGDGLHIHGFLDRIDVAPSGQVRIVDYKTGKAPALAWLGPYLFQLRFYALAWRVMHDVAPARLQLLFLKSAKTYTHDPSAAELEATEEELVDLWGDISAAATSGNFPPRRSKLCDWCDVRHLCPLFGGTPPEIPEDGITRLLSMHD